MDGLRLYVGSKRKWNGMGWPVVVVGFMWMWMWKGVMA